MQDNEEDWIFSDFSYGRAYSFAPRCAGFDVHSFPRGKERTKKTRQRLPPLETALPAVSEMNGGNFGDGKCPPSAGHISHPADGLTIGKILWAINDRPYEVKLTF